MRPRRRNGSALAPGSSAVRFRWTPGEAAPYHGVNCTRWKKGRTMHLLRRSSCLSQLARVVAILLLASAQQARAGGQGQGLPDPDFVTSFDPDFVFAAMNTSQVGAPAPRWVRLATPSTPCTDPQLGLPDPAGRLTVVDGVGSTDACIPDFISGATLPGKIRVATHATDPVLVDEGDPNTTDDDVF